MINSKVREYFALPFALNIQTPIAMRALIKIALKALETMYHLRKLAMRFFLIQLMILKLNAQITTVTYSYTGSAQTFVVPDIGCTPQITIEVRGASGASSATPGGNGGMVRGVLTATTGATLNVYVGGQGAIPTGGFNGGGAGGVGSNTSGGGGGGSSDIRLNGTSLNDRVIVAGGGGGSAAVMNTFLLAGAGGGGSICSSPLGFGGGNGSGCNAGVAGACTGGSVSLYASGGNGGGLNSGGGLAGLQSGGYGQAGALGQGGAGGGFSGAFGGGGGSMNGSGGGGGGYFGGSGAMSGSTTCCSGGGGGSSYINSSLFSNISFSPGLQVGHGQVVITYSASGPAITATPSQTALCNGNSATVIASGANSYTWSFGSNASSVALTPSSSITFTILGTNSLSCISSSIVTLHVANSVPSINIVNNNTICLGAPAILQASGALSYTWSNGAVNGLPFTTTTSSSYTVTGSNGCGTSSVVTTLSVIPKPLQIVYSPANVCSGKSCTLTVLPAASSFTWQPINTIETLGSVVINPTTSTVFSVAATDGTCRGSTTLSLTVNPVPTINIVVTSSAVCSGQSATLTASGGINYTWSPGNVIGNTIMVTPANSQLYQAVGDNTLGCTSTVAQPILVEPNPTLSISQSHSYVCAGSSVTLTANGATNYSWSPVVGAFSVMIVSPQVTTIYTVNGTASNSCSVIKTITVAAFNPSISINNVPEICFGASATLIASPAVSYTWNGIAGTATNIISPSTTTIYQLAVSNVSAALICTNTTSIQIVVNPLPDITLSASRNTICNGETVTLTATGALSYSLNGSKMFSDTLIEPSTTSDYTLTGLDNKGCKATTVNTVIVSQCLSTPENKLRIHPKIHPNPSIGFFKIHSLTDLSVLIYDQTGRVIKMLNLDSANDWKVTITGLQSGIYFVKSQNGKEAFVDKVVILD